MLLRLQTVSGIKWNGIAMVFVAFLQFATIAILARILTTSEFGLMSMAMIVIGIARSFSDMGMSNAIIQKQDATDDELSSIYWFSLLLGAICFGLVWASIPLVADYYKEPRIEEMLYLLSVVFLVIPIGRQFQVLLQKNMGFKALSVITIAGSIANAVISIALAFWGVGVLSLVFGQLGHTIVTTVMFIYSGLRQWKPRLHFCWADLKGYISFGLYQTGEALLNAITTDIDKILIGRYLGASALGLYSIAFQLVRLPIAAIDQLTGRVYYTILSLIQNETDRFRRAYSAAFHYNLAFLAPVLAGLAILADPFVSVVYGEKWLPAVDVIRILCLVHIVKSLGSNGGIVLLARGRADLSFYWKVGWTPVAVGACFMGIYIGHSIESVTWSMLAAILSVGSIWHYMIIRVGNIDYWELAKGSYGIILATLGMAISMQCLSLFAFPKLYLLLLSCLAGVAVYAILYRAVDRDHFSNLLKMVRR